MECDGFEGFCGYDVVGGFLEGFMGCGGNDGGGGAVGASMGSRSPRR